MDPRLTPSNVSKSYFRVTRENTDHTQQLDHNKQYRVSNYNTIVVLLTMDPRLT